MTDITSMQERLAFLDAEVKRTRADNTRYQRHLRGLDPHPGQEVAANAGYYSRRMAERRALRKGIADAEEAAAMDRRGNQGWPTRAEIAAELAAMSAAAESEPDPRVRRKRGLIDFIATAMGQESVVPTDDTKQRTKLTQFIDYCFDQIAEIDHKIMETTSDQTDNQAAAV